MAENDITERIRLRAYQIWESEGRPQGQDCGHWLRAEAEIRDSLAPAERTKAPPRPKEG